MGSRRYSKILTIILVIIIVSIIALIGYLAFSNYKRERDTKDASGYVDLFNKQIAEHEIENETVHCRRFYGQSFSRKSGGSLRYGQLDFRPAHAEHRKGKQFF